MDKEVLDFVTLEKFINGLKNQGYCMDTLSPHTMYCIHLVRVI